MFFAEDSDTGEIIPAVRGETATCPSCRTEVFGRGGVTELIRVHWAHRDGGDCDTWAEKFETQEAGEWHADWQNLASRARREVTMKRDGIHHRADIVSRDGQVIEIQHSTINKLQIEDREAFYGNMCWIWDTRNPHEKGNLKVEPSKNWELPANFRTFAWRSPRKSLLFSAKRSVFDLGDGHLLLVGKIGGTPGVLDGWGFWVDKATVIEWINEGPPDLPTDPRIAWDAKRKAKDRELAQLASWAMNPQAVERPRLTAVSRGVAVSQGISANQGGWGPCAECAHWMMLGQGLPTTCVICRSTANA